MALRDQLRVMVVDDMATSRGLITQALDTLGIANVATASDGRSALASLSANPVHLVISDYNMPEMDGLQLLQALRANPTTQRTGFLLITGRADGSVIERGRGLGMNNYIKKPFTPDDMRSAIEAVFGRL
jgi:two-component system, chemotaxis family, chemotaxis protein CheY